MEPKEAIKRLNEISPIFLRAIYFKSQGINEDIGIIITRLIEFKFYECNFLINSTINGFSKTMTFELFELFDNREILNGDRAMVHIPEFDIKFRFRQNDNAIEAIIPSHNSSPHSKEFVKEFASNYIGYLYEYLKVQKTK